MERQDILPTSNNELFPAPTRNRKEYCEQILNEIWGDIWNRIDREELFNTVHSGDIASACIREARKIMHTYLREIDRD